MRKYWTLKDWADHKAEFWQFGYDPYDNLTPIEWFCAKEAGL